MTATTSALAARRPTRAPRLAAVAAVALAAVSGCSGGGDEADDGERADPSEDTVNHDPTPVLGDRSDPLPSVTPTPRHQRWLGADLAVPESVTVEAAADADGTTIEAVTAALEAAGAEHVTVVEPPGAGGDGGETDGGGGEGGEADGGDDEGGETDGGDGEGGEARGSLSVRISSLDDDVRAELAAVGLAVPADLPPEGHALAAYGLSDGSGRVVLAGVDPAGTFYAAQTLRQLAARGAVRGVGVVDQPAMRHRGTIEGFYGSPWTTDERIDQLRFHGRYKLNTYVYAPKDDPYHRDRWREPYPPDALAGLHTLVEEASANHVQFTFAVSPGVSICYSDPADLAALVAKLEAVHAIGVRAFSIALDDIDASRWNCPADESAYGPPTSAASGRAQVDLLNAVQSGFVAAHPGVAPLQTVPTDYRGTGDDPYRAAFRERLAPEIEVMWTGAYVVPDEITTAQAAQAASTYGRPLFVWDNTPVNDYPPTEGRLILAPYARREAGLSAHVTGIVLNPMNQAAASKVQLMGAADFTWNDAAYDPARAHRAAAADLAGGDPATVEALLAFFDLEHLAPTSASTGRVSQPQAPALAAALDAFRSTWAAGDRPGALDAMRPVAERIAGAPDRIRRNVDDPGFVADCGPWLDATALWGRAFVRTLDGLAARVAGDAAAASGALAEADALATEAAAIRTIPGKTRPEGPVRVGDGVLDDFLAEAPGLG